MSFFSLGSFLSLSPLVNGIDNIGVYQASTKETELKRLLAERYNLPIEAIQLEMLDHLQVITYGAPKHGTDDWIYPEGKTMSRKKNSDSMFHHLARHFSGEQTDSDSKLNHLLHLACRAMMRYTREARKIQHPEDV